VGVSAAIVLVVLMLEYSVQKECVDQRRYKQEESFLGNDYATMKR
jgi:hypothetical protein